MKCLPLISITVLTLALACTCLGKLYVSTPNQRLQTISSAEKIAALTPQNYDDIPSAFQERLVKKEKIVEVNDSSKLALAGNTISQSLNPTGILRLGSETYLMFAGSNKLKTGDAYAVTINKEQYIIQITRIGADDFDFKYKDQTFSRLIKVK